MQWFKTKGDEKRFVFDPIRKKYCALTPEEEVRQKTLYLLVNQLNVPAGLIAVEHSIKVNQLDKRCDIVVFNTKGEAVMIVECKSEQVKITQKTLDQAIRYNFALHVKYLMLTNGKEIFCYEINDKEHNINTLNELPDFNILCS